MASLTQKTSTKSYIVECKRSPEKPWILFTQKNKIIDWEHTGWYCTTELGWNYILHAAIDGKFDKLPLTYHLRDHIAYGVTTAFAREKIMRIKQCIAQLVVQFHISKRQKIKNLENRSISIF